MEEKIKNLNVKEVSERLEKLEERVKKLEGAKE